MNNRHRMIKRAQKQFFNIQNPSIFDMNQFSDAFRALGVSIKNVAAALNNLIGSLDWAEIAKAYLHERNFEPVEVEDEVN